MADNMAVQTAVADATKWGALVDLKGFVTTSVKESTNSLRNSSLSIRRSYLTLFLMYCSLFVVGLGTAIAAIIKGFLATNPGETIPALVFAGLSATSFFTLFITNPLVSLERNAIYSSWLIAAVNTYWTQLMYIIETGKDQPEMLKNATEELVNLLTKLADKHEEATAKQPALTASGGDTATPKANGGSSTDASRSPTPTGHGENAASPKTNGSPPSAPTTTAAT